MLLYWFLCQADAFLLAIAGGPDLLARIQTRYFEKSKSNVARVCYQYAFLAGNTAANRAWSKSFSCLIE